ncbi:MULTISPECIES: type II toxin-antitoxin system RelE/ParE family toxin [unclassified Mesorhizobium]|uniref:type II toxin-antitoxin system RelE/ParE family toxin n=1 Tax=unclassified Mesorhizobium TaxID=325217 RepID=UPI000BAEE07D|nr:MULTISPECIES: type II toxin-antitoxin system RelE/ParE family toxin [unclassified Mesorhizobium]TGT57323.1 type II toxin-antitoxin system RelE/ParE family toxin [Mesorhizobium sp. M00.F.Ca.ET.170.01.1.1]AZO11945.1 type II toxin-antitoxin system RelE/ParE family toxin [Mesorhizobium sp. M3A.F.Ca.ET.080.04.2.1]PBB86161.1 plasmid stabilization protein ParE [Mesorhizobium sp. WSM3876]RWB73228.1 MAG: type II toxin-antitoxin system RelE/ParE family toxin [Mesorhizobium sp.]RWB83277.1 MAG: type II
MKRTVRISPRAKRDLDGIWDYSLNQWGAERAEAYIRSIHSVVTLMDQFPAIARNASDVRPGLLKYAVGSHVVYLRMNHQSIDIVRILHQQMDYPRHL